MWSDDGVNVKLYVSTDGDFVSLGTRTDYPFTAAGAGIPAGWTQYVEGGAVGDVNWTTSYGRFSVSNASLTETRNGNQYGIYRDFPVQAGHNYLVQVRAQTMDGKQAPHRRVVYQYQATGTKYGSTMQTESSWEQISLPAFPATGTTVLRVFLMVNPFWGAGSTPQIDWGGQFQNVAIVDMLSAYPDPTWREVTCDVQSVSTHYGRPNFRGRYDVASCQVGISNQDGEFTFQYDHEWGLRPGRFIKITVSLPDAPGIETPFYYGIIDSLTDTYTLDGKAIVSMDCVDTSSLLSNTNVPTATSPGSVFMSGDRFTRVYQAAGWLRQMTSVDTGVFLQQPIIANGRTIRDELGLIADSEGGFFYTDRLGKLVFRNRNAPDTMPAWRQVQAELMAMCADYLTPVVLDFPGTPANWASVAHDDWFNVGPTNAQMMVRVQMRDMLGPDQVFMAKGIAWWIGKQAGTKNLQATMAGGTSVVSTAPLPINNGEWVWLRFARDATNLAFGYCRDDGTNAIPAVSAFTRLGNLIPITGNLPTSAQPVQIGARSLTGIVANLNGRIRRAVIMDSNLQTANIVMDVDVDVLAGNEGEVSVTIATGQIMSLIQTDDVSILQKDLDVPPRQLVPVDEVPTTARPAIVFLRSLATDWSRADVINELQLANQGGSAFQWIDGESQRKYGPRTYQRLDLLNDNAHPEYLEARKHDIMDGNTEAMLRVNSVGFRPDPSTYRWAVNAFLNDLVRVRYSHPTAGWGFAVASHIQAIDHQITTKEWLVGLTLDEPESFVRWNDASGGIGWDVSEWDGAVWDDEMYTNSAIWSAGFRWSNPESKWGE